MSTNPSTSSGEHSLRGAAAAALFGDSIVSYSDVAAAVLRSESGVRYRFEANASYMANIRSGTYDIRRANQIYWTEILFRCHFASVSSVARAVRWMEGCVVASEHNNYLLFCAAGRALVEATGDTIDALLNIPQTLADNFDVISLCLAGSYDEQVSVSDLEERLIHYSHGRTVAKSENAPAAHKAESARHYVERSAKVLPGVVDFYSELCQVTHPAAFSVLTMLEPEGEAEGERFRLNLGRDRLFIDALADTYKSLFERIPEIALNLGLVTLMVVDEFKVLPAVTSIARENLSQISLWQRAWTAIEAHRGFSKGAIGRNDPCPCGSGKKFKKCHGVLH